ncbi:hypothetical protein CGRA01v4_10458 [Colletotrichum graminicola]|uniref:Nuclear pore protein n=1 Tax=Colletotrichum graminicola (strain M1.001 / M2 / FGSC 10212) TaxID=645133 RepID=E3QZX1_COLGM|nr:uncharacterized protein GLRG_11537 [Colletotrichum graminicola M1.001]EFQ36409.1 hypothetical protein GLRG_11537 [Colletotrichum graminicola M1.001]WDK19171.1 hypothetical protein CGRA01v4_10458 [Colletotrichum graminicola]
MALKNLALRPAADVVAEYDSDTETEWVQTPSDDTLPDEDEIKIDPNGDLLLRTGADPSSGDTLSFRVCSNTLRRSSSFWKRSLYEMSSETITHDGEWWACTPSLYACQYDKSSGLIILLNIIHSKFHQVPRDATVTEIYNTLCLASLYEMEEVLQPWIAQWYGALKNAETSRSGRDLGMLACIAWTLGDERLFQKMIAKITLTCVADEEGHLMTADGVRLDDYTHDFLGSPLISETIRTKRSQLALDLPSHLNHLVDRLIEGKWLCVGISDIPVTRDKKCDYIVLGSVFAGLIYVRGSRATEVEIRSDESIMDLLKSLKRVLSYMTCYEKHLDCNPAERIVAAMMETVDGVDVPLNTDCTLRMREQRQKLGLENKS